MAESLTVSLSDLRTTLGRALDAAEEHLGAHVSLDVDHYWHLPVKHAFDLTSEPENFTVGQVSDDLESLAGSRYASAETAWHDLSHLIGVLRALELASRP